MCEGVNNSSSNDWRYEDNTSWDWYAPTTQSPEAHGGAGGHGYGGAGGTGYGVVYEDSRHVAVMAHMLGTLGLMVFGLMIATALVAAVVIGVIALQPALLLGVGLMGTAKLLQVILPPILTYKDRKEQRAHQRDMLLLGYALSPHGPPAASQQPTQMTITRPAALPTSEPTRRALPAPDVVEGEIIFTDFQEAAEYARLQRGQHGTNHLRERRSR